MVTERLVENQQEKDVVCPNCGLQQQIAGFDTRCAKCDYLIYLTGSHPRQMSPEDLAGRATSRQVPPPRDSGGIGGYPDETKLPRHPSDAVQGEPMISIGDGSTGSSKLDVQALPSPAAPHNARGGAN